MSDTPDKFRSELLRMGIIAYDEQDTLWRIAQRCARTVGVPMGAGWAVLGAGGGSVTIPGLGAVPGAVAGFLAGMTAGTFACTTVNLRYREDLRRLLDDAP